MSPPLGVAAWVLGAIASLLGYVLPVERLVAELVRRREGSPPIRVDATLDGVGYGWPDGLTFELHPLHGMRILDSRGGRWLIRRGRFVAGSRLRAPVWIPEIEILFLREEPDLQVWLERLGVDVTRSELARCGEIDCLVLGGRDRATQLWLDKDRLDVLRLVLPEGREVRLEDYQEVSGVRFPQRIRILDREGELARLELTHLRRAPELEDVEFGPDWVREGVPNLPE